MTGSFDARTKDSLAALVKNELRKELFTHSPAGDLPCKSAGRGGGVRFRAKRADRLKMLYWDGTGLVPFGTLLRNALPADG